MWSPAGRRATPARYLPLNKSNDVYHEREDSRRLRCHIADVIGLLLVLLAFCLLLISAGDFFSFKPRSLAFNIRLPALLPTSSRLRNFQVQQPPPHPSSAACSYTLITHSFANSYGQPAVAAYTPPTDCGPVGEWAAITFNFTATSKGRQYDRLAVISLSSTELWRTSTAEPTPNGIVFTALKDVTRYSYLFTQPGNLVFDLGNLVSEELGLTGVYNCTLTATFYAPSPGWPKTQKADWIIPLGNPNPTSNPVFSVPPGGNTSVSLPRNTAQAFVEIYASGTYIEEFWYNNVADEFLYDLPNGAAYGRGPFREVRLLIDGQVAGAAFPFPVVFTGGILPTLWRPMSAYGSFDQPTYYVDITPWLGVLTDGNPHVFTLDVAGPESNHTINPSWYLSGNIQLQLASNSVPTTGAITYYDAAPYAASSIAGVISDTGDVTVTVESSRYVRIEAEITTGGSDTKHVVWTQSLEYSNTQKYLENADRQIVSQTSWGTSMSTHDGQQMLYDQFTYPFYSDYYTLAEGNTSGWGAAIDHAYNRQFLPGPLIPESTIKTRQQGSGVLMTHSNGSLAYANGTTNETFSYSDSTGDTYTRIVRAVNSGVVEDEQGGTLADWAREAWGWDTDGVVEAMGGFVARLAGPGRKEGRGSMIW